MVRGARTEVRERSGVGVGDCGGVDGGSVGYMARTRRRRCGWVVVIASMKAASVVEWTEAVVVSWRGHNDEGAGGWWR